MIGSALERPDGAQALLLRDTLGRMRAGLGDELVIRLIAEAYPSATSDDLDDWQAERRVCPVAVALRLDTASHIWAVAEKRLGSGRAALAFVGPCGISDEPLAVRLICQGRLSEALAQAAAQVAALERGTS